MYVGSEIVWTGEHNAQWGVHYGALTSTAVTVERGDEDFSCESFRIMIWQIGEGPS